MSLSGEAVLYAVSPSDKKAQESARRERRRRKVYQELFGTEKTYLHHLELVNKFFDFPLRFAYIVPEDVHNRIFSNLEQIREVNVKLLDQMEQTTVGQAFTFLGPFLKLYSTYAQNHQCALSTLQEWQTKSPDFARFLSKQEDRPELMGLKLNALLITPIQRIPRYRLLLEELLNHTPVEHHDYDKLREATEKIVEIASHINEHVRQNENFVKMLSIQKMFDSSAPKLLIPGRQFIKEGLLKKVSRRGGKSYDRMFFLFSDILLYGKPKFLDGGGRSYTCSCVLPLRHCKIEAVLMTGGVTHANTGGVFRIACKEESLVLYSEDKSEAREWMEEIDRAVRKVCDDRQTLRKPSSNKIPLRGRSLRKHRQEQKKTDFKIPGKTPQRPLSVISSYDLNCTDQENSPKVSAPSRSARRQLGAVQDASSMDDEDWQDLSAYSSPVLRKRMLLDSYSSRGGLARDRLGSTADSGSDSYHDSCRDSLRSSVSLDSGDRSYQSGPPKTRQGHNQTTQSRCGDHFEVQDSGNVFAVQRDDFCTRSVRQTGMSRQRLTSPTSASTSSLVWYPPNSLAHKYTAPGKNNSSKFGLCLGNPLKRFQRGKPKPKDKHKLEPTISSQRRGGRHK